MASVFVNLPKDTPMPNHLAPLKAKDRWPTPAALMDLTAPRLRP